MGSRPLSIADLRRALDAEVTGIRSRPLTDAAFPYLWLDATYLKVRESGRVVSMACLVATGWR
jgi:putative transposase